MLNKTEIKNQLKSKWPIITLWVIIFLGAFLRIYHLGAESMWLDEACSVMGSRQSLKLVIESSGNLHNQPPLYFIILHFWMIFFGTTEVAARSLSAICGIISVYFIYKIGSQLVNKKVAFIGSFLSAISAFLIEYSQEARAYSLLLLLSLLSFYLFIKILKTNRPNKLYFLHYLLINLGLVYTHVFGIFVIFSQVFYFAIF
jgi:mannosyltransferase